MAERREIERPSIIERGLLINKELFYNNMELDDVNNKVWISGELEDDFVYSHSFIGREYYKTRVKVKRLSGVEDFVPVVVKKSLLANLGDTSLKGKYIEVVGRYACHKYAGDDEKVHFEYFVAASNINLCEKYAEDVNLVYLDGFVYREPVYRVTPLGRVITDVMVAIHKENTKGKDYCWCIAWEEYALNVKKMNIGERIQLCGRIQSREYFKRISEDSEELTKTTYEISISDIKR